MAVKHTFTSAKADDPDTSLIRPSNWNANHTLTGPLAALDGLADATGVLSNNGAGVLSWAAGGGSGTVTSVTAGAGMTQSGVASVNPTLDVVSAAGTAGSVGTLVVNANDVGVSLGNTSTTACAGNDSRLSDARTPSNDANIVHIAGTETITGAKTFNLDIKNPIAGTPITVSNAYYNGTNSVDAFCQFHIANKSATANASTDFIATADNGTDTTNYVNLGINGSAYSVGTWTINGALDGYLYAQSSGMAVGTATAGKNLVLFTGGTLAANARLTISDTAVTAAASAPFTGPGTGLTGTAAGFTVGTATNATQLGGVAAASYALLNSPSFTTPTLGVATATSINKVAITAPTTSATLTLVTGSTLQTTGAFTLNLTTTAASTPTFPTGAGTLVYLGGTNTWTLAQTFSATSVHTLGATMTASASVATAGYFGYNSTQLAHEFFANGLKQMNTGTMFTQTATGTNGAATAITNILGTGVGTTALPASFSLIGKTVRIRCWGTVTTAASPGTTVITLRWNAATPVSIVASPSLTLTASMTSMPFMIDLTLTYRTTTTAIAGGTFVVSNSTTGISALTVPIGTTTAATIVAATSYTPQVCSTNGTASGTVYTTQGATIEILN